MSSNTKKTLEITYPDSLDIVIRKKSIRIAITSSCFGALSQLLVRDSSIIILYANKLGAGRFLSLATASLFPLSAAFLAIPFAYFMEHTGKKRVIIPSVLPCTLQL